MNTWLAFLITWHVFGHEACCICVARWRRRWRHWLLLSLTMQIESVQVEATLVGRIVNDHFDGLVDRSGEWSARRRHCQRHVKEWRGCGGAARYQDIKTTNLFGLNAVIYSYWHVSRTVHHVTYWNRKQWCKSIYKTESCNYVRQGCRFETSFKFIILLFSEITLIILSVSLSLLVIQLKARNDWFSYN